MNKLNDLIKSNFIESFSTITGISIEKLEEYAKSNDVFNIVYHPKVIKPTKNQLKKIELLNEFVASYKVMQKNNELGKVQIDSPQKVADYLIALYGNAKDKEKFSVLFLNIKNAVIELRTISEGSISSTVVYPREIAKQALDNNSSAVIICHNHPSGNTYPSKEDQNITANLVHALGVFDIKVLDHIIVGNDNYYSFKENAMMPYYSGAHQSLHENKEESYISRKKVLCDVKENIKLSKSGTNVNRKTRSVTKDIIK